MGLKGKVGEEDGGGGGEVKFRHLTLAHASKRYSTLRDCVCPK